ncbi:hypothetical protein [Rhizobium sp. YS-1r]|uniref:hypothetical protein n=1 Tax=Rhizobium sp. YS-1r TaxID=1532558 RepID=UPI00050E399B|nr:hypothetical protein [Rhizobium sp. YS-1r]KGE00715.1 hypothetical protein JL39_06065 [Rhizobium sp. YS-1r]
MASEKLEKLLQRIVEWTPISDFHLLCDEYFTSSRPEEEIKNFRLGKSDLKKLRDEVVPALHFTKATRVSGQIKFALSDTVPDCWIEGMEAPQTVRGIEITRAQAASQYWLATELNEHGHGRGFLNIPDGSENAQFREALAKPARAHSTDEALSAAFDGVKKCLVNKNHKKYAEHHLLIEAPIGNETLPAHYWQSIVPSLKKLARSLPSPQIHLIGKDPAETLYFRLK